MSKFDRIFDYIKKGRTLLGVGPMSRNCVDAVVEVANEYQIPMLLIGSRRQIECSELGGGYVWDTESFAQYVRTKDVGNQILLARDHGGPWQGTNESDLNREQANDRAMISYGKDIESGFDIIHVDPSLKDRSLREIMQDVYALLTKCEVLASGKDIVYEVGTEEHSGKISDIKTFEHFVSELIDFDYGHKVKFVVGNTGLWVKEDSNVGKLDIELTKELVRVANKWGVNLKAHNTDYIYNRLSSAPSNAKTMNLMGVHSANIAPEFGVLETRTLLSLWSLRGHKKEVERFQTIAYESGAWKKWMMKENLEGAPDWFKAELAGHYVFNKPEIVELRKEMDNYYSCEQHCKEVLKNLVVDYLYQYGWKFELEPEFG